MVDPFVLIKDPFDLDTIPSLKALELFHHLLVKAAALIRSASAPIRDEFHSPSGAFNHDSSTVFRGERADERAALRLGFLFFIHFGTGFSAFALIWDGLAGIVFTFFLVGSVGLATLRLFSESAAGKQACRR